VGPRWYWAARHDHPSALLAAVRRGRFRWIGDGPPTTARRMLTTPSRRPGAGADDRSVCSDDGEPIVFRDFVTELLATGYVGLQIGHPARARRRRSSGGLAALRLKAAPPVTTIRPHGLSSLEVRSISPGAPRAGYQPSKTRAAGLARAPPPPGRHRSDGLAYASRTAHEARSLHHASVHDQIDIDATPGRVWREVHRFPLLSVMEPVHPQVSGKLKPGRRAARQAASRTVAGHPAASGDRRQAGESCGGWPVSRAAPVDVERCSSSRTGRAAHPLCAVEPVGLVGLDIMPILHRRSQRLRALNKALKARAER